MIRPNRSNIPDIYFWSNIPGIYFGLIYLVYIFFLVQYTCYIFWPNIPDIYNLVLKLFGQMSNANDVKLKKKNSEQNSGEILF